MYDSLSEWKGLEIDKIQLCYSGIIRSILFVKNNLELKDIFWDLQNKYVIIW